MEASAFVLPQEAIDKIFQEAPTRYDWRKIYKLARIITFYKYYNHDSKVLQRILWELNRYLNQLDTIMDPYQIQRVTEDLLTTELHIRKDVFNLAFESLNNNGELREFFQMDEEPSDELTMELFKNENQTMMVHNSYKRHDFFWLQERQPVPIELERILGKSVFQKVQEFVDVLPSTQDIMGVIPTGEEIGEGVKAAGRTWVDIQAALLLGPGEIVAFAADKIIPQEIVDFTPSAREFAEALPSRQDFVDAIPTSEDLVEGTKVVGRSWLAIQWGILMTPGYIAEAGTREIRAEMARKADEFLNSVLFRKIKLGSAAVVVGGLYVYTQ